MTVYMYMPIYGIFDILWYIFFWPGRFEFDSDVILRLYLVNFFIVLIRFEVNKK